MLSLPLLRFPSSLSFQRQKWNPRVAKEKRKEGDLFRRKTFCRRGPAFMKGTLLLFSQRSKIGTSYFSAFQTGGNPSVSTIAMIFPFSSNSVRSRSLTLKLLFRRMALPPSFLHYFFLESRYTDDDDDDDRSFLSFQSTIKRKTE